MTQIGDIAKAAFDTFTLEPDVQQRLVFRMFDGSALALAAESGGSVSSSDITVVSLRVNPENIAYAEPKVTQKIQTGAPGRWVVFDWGTDLLTVTISGNTGNLLPGVVLSGGNPTGTVIDSVAELVNSTASSIGVSGGIIPSSSSILGKVTYTELLEMSPKYRTFRKLQSMYRLFDADYDVLTLEIGDEVHRGYFQDFTFEQNANNPWNWKYNVIFISLVNLAEYMQRTDEDFPQDPVVIDPSE
jgi:hypothetical protein